jgi:hypothetical protein
LKNPHNIHPAMFPMKPENGDFAMYGRSDIQVINGCNENAHSFTSMFGTFDANEPGRDRATFFTGGPNFKVQEIKVFEITD